MGRSTKEVVISISNTVKYKFQVTQKPTEMEFVNIWVPNSLYGYTSGKRSDSGIEMLLSLTSERSGLCFVFIVRLPVLLKLTDIIL